MKKKDKIKILNSLCLIMMDALESATEKEEQLENELSKAHEKISMLDEALSLRYKTIDSLRNELREKTDKVQAITDIVDSLSEKIERLEEQQTNSPHWVSTAEELNALPTGAWVVADDGESYKKIDLKLTILDETGWHSSWLNETYIAQEVLEANNGKLLLVTDCDD